MVFEAVTVKNECGTAAKNELLQSLDAFFLYDSLHDPSKMMIIF